MKRMFAFLSVCLLSSLSFAGTITVAAAISTKDALTQIAQQYKADTGEAVEFTFGSSGQLANQISNGAPVDLFISAATKQVNDLVKAGTADGTTVRVVAGGSLVIIVPADSTASPASVKALADPSVTKIAVGESRSVPAGQYAEQSLKHEGVFDAVKEKLVAGMNVRQVLDYVERHEVAAGLVYSADAKVAGEKVRVTCTVDDADHDPIVYPAVIINGSKKSAAAQKFVDYLLSNRAQATLRAFAFTPPPSTPATQPTR